MNECPCGVGSDYEACCGPLHRGERRAETAEELLRSRYAAFVKDRVDYVLATTLPEQRDRVDREAVEAWAKGAEWHGLEIEGREGGGPEDEEGWIDFRARYTEEGRAIEHVERAHFRRMEGVWYFDHSRSGAPPLEPVHPVGRNDPCPCGSGKKYKKCCGKAK